MIPHRLIPLLILFLTIMGASVVLVYLRSSSPLRRDPVPSGAYIVPWVRPNPSIETLGSVLPETNPWRLEEVMSGALKINVTFRVTLPNGTRIVPSLMYLGHDDQYLYVGGRFEGIYGNPTSTNRSILADKFYLYLDARNTGTLTAPESAVALATFISCPLLANTCTNSTWNNRSNWFYADVAWTDNEPAIGRGIWNDAHAVCPTVTPSFGGFITEYAAANGTLAVLYSRHLDRPASCANAVYIRPGERWVMGFLFELWYSNGQATGNFQDFVDGWPRKIYPYLTNDASWWPKLVIDLSNPPASY